MIPGKKNSFFIMCLYKFINKNRHLRLEGQG